MNTTVIFPALLALAALMAGAAWAARRAWRKRRTIPVYLHGRKMGDGLTTITVGDVDITEWVNEIRIDGAAHTRAAAETQGQVTVDRMWVELEGRFAAARQRDGEEE